MQNYFYQPSLPRKQNIQFYLPDGIYLVTRKSVYVPIVKEHYGVAVIGKYLRYFGFNDNKSRVFHKTNEGIWADFFIVSDWQALGLVPHNWIPLAIMRTRVAVENNDYNLFTNNCEHFARFITEGKSRSTQSQTAGLVCGLVIACLLLRDE